jgi:hypothetical protein
MATECDQGMYSRVKVGDAADNGLRGGSFDAEIVERHPGEFHRLNRDQDGRHGNRRVGALDDERGRGVADCEH